MKKRVVVYAGIGLFIFAGTAATSPPQEKPGWKNLKVLPKKLDEDQMERIMGRYSKNLGVNCSYCHPDTKPDIFPRRVDFVSDEIPQKEVARKMIRMTEKLNRKYFNYKNDYGFESFKNAIITCQTCHRGLPKPRNIPLYTK
jgi:hypothetical protein